MVNESLMSQLPDHLDLPGLECLLLRWGRKGGRKGSHKAKAAKMEAVSTTKQRASWGTALSWRASNSKIKTDSTSNFQKVGILEKSIECDPKTIY